MDKWREVMLSDVADDVTVGHVGAMALEYRDSGIPFLRSQNVRSHRIDLTDVKFIDQDFHRRLKKSALAPGDVVTVRTGKPGTSAVVPESMPVANCSDLVITRPGPGLNARWLSYYLNFVIDSHIGGHLVGAVQQHFNVQSAKKLTLLLPEVGEQRAIADVLGSLDDKIAANQSISDTTTTLVSELYRHAVAEGARTVSLFDVIDVDFGEAFKGDQFVSRGTGRPLIRIRDLNTFNPQVSTTESRVGEAVVQPGDVLVGMDAEFRATWWVGRQGLLNQRVCRLRGKGTGSAFTAECVRKPLAAIENQKSATTVIHLNKSDLARAYVELPESDALARFEEQAQPLVDCYVTLALESRRLACTRDELLPLLMSGKVRVKDAETVVSETL